MLTVLQGGPTIFCCL